MLLDKQRGNLSLCFPSDQSRSGVYTLFHKGVDNIYFLALWAICFLSQLLSSAIVVYKQPQSILKWMGMAISLPGRIKAQNPPPQKKRKGSLSPLESPPFDTYKSRYPFKFSLFLPGPIKQEFQPFDKYWEEFYDFLANFSFLLLSGPEEWVSTYKCVSVSTEFFIWGSFIPVYSSVFTLYCPGLLYVVSLLGGQTLQRQVVVKVGKSAVLL